MSQIDSEHGINFDPIKELRRMKREIAVDVQNLCFEKGLTVGESIEALDLARASILSTTKVSLIQKRI